MPPNGSTQAPEPPSTPAQVPPTQDLQPSPRPAQWLVSVRSLAEAELASRFGVDIIDLKEPNHGPLAAVERHVWQSVADRIRPQPADQPTAAPLSTPLSTPLSAALGERDQAAQIARDVPAEFAFAKAGPSQCGTEARVVELWNLVRRDLPPTVELVAVAYADHAAAGSLPPEQILELAARNGFQRILLDTFGKNGSSSIDVLGTSRLAKFGTLAKQNSLWWSLAGSIRLPHLAELKQSWPDPQSSPDCLAVRGDVCQRDRQGTLCPERLQQWKQSLAAVASHRPVRRPSSVSI